MHRRKEESKQARADRLEEAKDADAQREEAAKAADYRRTSQAKRENADIHSNYVEVMTKAATSVLSAYSDSNIVDTFMKAITREQS